MLLSGMGYVLTSSGKLGSKNVISAETMSSGTGKRTSTSQSEANEKYRSVGTGAEAGSSAGVSVGAGAAVTTGAAEILSNVDGEQVQRFSIRIDRVDPDAKNGRNLLITVTDEALLAKTGGIVQGMSGSPILQNGKLVGAVTHVLVNDPTMGYGVLIENMLEMAK